VHNPVKEFLVEPGSKLKLADIDPAYTDDYADKQAAADRLQENLDRLSVLQYRLYAENKRALLIVLQGIDAAGKDGTIRHVMAGMNPQGVHVVPFKVPAGEELQHDYLWRVHKKVPQFGQIGIFNRSHYEEVLVVRVHELVPKKVWSKRYEQINCFEKMLSENNVSILKFFLYISKDEQKKRFEERLRDPEKSWKFSEADLAERKYWDQYIEAYEDALSECSTEWAPWYVIPANKKWFRNLTVSEIIRAKLEDMDIQVPRAPKDLAKIEFE
jgi:PPK2 family polyphosphate:nucleotide phosphotransferase